MKKAEDFLTRILWIFGLILLLISVSYLIYQIYNLFQIQWSTLKSEDQKNLISYIVLEFTTLVFQIILSSYAMYSKKDIDAVINPLFTFTILFSIFSIIQLIAYVTSGSEYESYMIIRVHAIIDTVLAGIFLIITLIFKIDDWRPYKKGE